MSRPAQNPRPAPVMTITRTLSSKFACQMTLRISRSMRSSNALSLSGRLSVTTTIPSSGRSTRIVR